MGIIGFLMLALGLSMLLTLPGWLIGRLSKWDDYRSMPGRGPQLLDWVAWAVGSLCAVTAAGSLLMNLGGVTNWLLLAGGATLAQVCAFRIGRAGAARTAKGSRRPYPPQEGPVQVPGATNGPYPPPGYGPVSEPGVGPWATDADYPPATPHPVDGAPFLAPSDEYPPARPNEDR